MANREFVEWLRVGAHRVRRLLRCAYIALVLVKILAGVEVGTVDLFSSSPLLVDNAYDNVFGETLVKDSAPKAKIFVLVSRHPLKERSGPTLC